MDQRSYFLTWSKQESENVFDFDHAKGPYLYTKDGKKILDISSTSYHTIFGLNHPSIVKAITKQMEKFSVASPKSIFPLKEEVSKELLSYMGKKSGKIFYTLSGAESIENAAKMARKTTGRKIILARKVSYHGATLGALSLTGDWRNESHQTLDEWTVRIPEPSEDPDCIRTRNIILEVGPEKIAAFCLETITGGNGVIIASKKWWKAIEALCKEFDIQLILDEVVCGFNRTGKNFGFEHYKINADYICLAKGITSGHIPFGAVWVNKKRVKELTQDIFSFGLTNYAHPLGLKATSAVLKLLKSEKIRNNILDLQKELKLGAKEFEKLSIVKEVRSIGLLTCIEFHDKHPHFVELLKRDLYAATPGNSIILAPNYITTPKQLAQALTKIADYLEELERKHVKDSKKRTRSA